MRIRSGLGFVRYPWGRCSWSFVLRVNDILTDIESQIIHFADDCFWQSWTWGHNKTSERHRSWGNGAWDYPAKCEPRHDKTNKMSVRPAKTLISVGIRPVWSESLLCAQWVAKDSSFIHADSEDADQTGWMPRLIWVFAERILILLVLSRGGACNK